MNIKTWIKIDNAIELIFQCHVYVIVGICVLIASPFILLYKGAKHVNRKVKGLVYDSVSKEWITKEQMEAKILRKKIEAREMPLDVEHHVTVDKNDKFLFFSKRKLIVPYYQLVYVEAEYDECIHAFFTENAGWLETWQRWHGFDIVEYDAEDIKEGMLYPQDYAVFKHGFLWRSPVSSWDKDSEVYGNIHHYFEIDTNSEMPIKEQMERMMSKIYDVIE